LEHQDTLTWDYLLISKNSIMWGLGNWPSY